MSERCQLLCNFLGSFVLVDQMGVMAKQISGLQFCHFLCHNLLKEGIFKIDGVLDVCGIFFHYFVFLSHVKQDGNLPHLWS